MTIVKVCGMRDHRNIAEVARLAPDLMGFIFWEHSPRNACSLQSGALDVLSVETKRVGVFVDAPEEYILETAHRYSLDFVQLHGSESPETCAALRRHLGVIKAFGIGEGSDVERAVAYEGSCDIYLFDTRSAAHGGTGRQFDHSLLTAFRGRTPYLLSGGLGPEDAVTLAARREPPCAGFDINSRFETAPGIKDPEVIRKFLKSVKNQNNE